MDDLIKRQDAIIAYCEHECGIKGMTRENCEATDCGTIFDDIPSAQPEQPFEIQEILDYLDTVLHPIISPEHWNVYSELHDMISTLPSAQPEQRWIPCSERLPEKSGRYLVTRGLNACGSLWNRIYISNYSDLMGIKSERIWWQGNVGKPDFERLDDVLAWMPLPEPYKGEES